MRCACAFVAVASAGQLDLDEQTHPVVKVVNMLKTMKSETEEEGAKDKELHDKMQCWCTTGRANKEQAIEDAGTRITELDADVEADSAAVSKLSTEIDQAKKDRADNKKSVATAESMRAKEHDEFSEEETDLSTAINQLDRAIESLEKNFGADGSTLLQVRDIVRTTAQKYRDVLDMDLDGIVGDLSLDDDTKQVQGQEVTLAEILAPQKLRRVAFSQQPAGFKSYNAKSGKILGLLKQMQEGMEHEDEESTATEKAQAEAFAELKTTLKKEIATQTNKINDKTTALADTKVDLENSESDLEETQATLEADEKFLADLEETCTKADNEYDARVKERSEELQAVAETIGILTSDEARELFSSSGQFVQVQQTTSLKVQERVRMSRASALLKAAAQKSGSRALLGLSVSLKIHGLEKVKKAMEEMIANLKTEQAEEFEKKDHCDENINKNEDDTTEAKFQKKQEETKIQDLEVQISDLTDELAALEKDISETQTAVKRAGEDRGMASRLYQKVVAEQRATQKILEFALKKLDSFYNKKSLLSIAIHRSQAPGEAPPPPPEQATYEKKGAATGVMEMIKMIIADAKRDEQAAIADEKDSQEEYEKLLRDSFDGIKRNQRAITDKKALKADAESELGATNEELKDTEQELDELQMTNMQLHAECDYLVANFKARQQGRAGEIENIENAMAIMAGAK
mmetsp:Transcript_27329/g.62288  ORF Transcript_27329/g.62288 Transcript_27329/m.62288 type:complete len:692 (-) Transcript_27329:46-2121(-)